MAVNDERYVFIVEWFDTSASLIRNYNLTFFMADKTIEMVRSFPIPQVRPQEQAHLPQTLRVPCCVAQRPLHRLRSYHLLAPAENRRLR